MIRKPVFFLYSAVQLSSRYIIYINLDLCFTYRFSWFYIIRENPFFFTSENMNYFRYIDPFFLFFFFFFRGTRVYKAFFLACKSSSLFPAFRLVQNQSCHFGLILHNILPWVEFLCLICSSVMVSNGKCCLKTDDTAECWKVSLLFSGVHFYTPTVEC